MKTLVDINTYISLYLFDDSETILLLEDRVIVGNPVQFVIADLKSSNTFVFENVTPPQDWCGRKYAYDGNAWTLNSDFIDSQIDNNQQQMQIL